MSSLKEFSTKLREATEKSVDSKQKTVARQKVTTDYLNHQAFLVCDNKEVITVNKRFIQTGQFAGKFEINCGISTGKVESRQGQSCRLTIYNHNLITFYLDAEQLKKESFVKALSNINNLPIDKLRSYFSTTNISNPACGNLKIRQDLVERFNDSTKEKEFIPLDVAEYRNEIISNDSEIMFSFLRNGSSNRTKYHEIFTSTIDKLFTAITTAKIYGSDIKLDLEYKKLCKDNDFTYSTNNVYNSSDLSGR